MNKVTIITGASSGIGLATVYEFARQGFNVVLAARNVEKLNGIVKELTAKYPDREFLALPTDVQREEECRRLVEKTIEKFGRIDVLVNNAGISMRAMFKELDLSVIKRLMDVNFWGTVYCTKYALPYLLKERGSVVG